MEEPPPVDGLPDHRRRRGGADRKRRIRDDELGRQSLHPAEERPCTAAPDQYKVMLDQQLGDELVVAGGHGVLGRLDREPPRAQPAGRTPMELRRSARLVCGALQFGELREQRMDAIPASVLQADDELIGALEVRQQRRRVRALEHVRRTATA